MPRRLPRTLLLCGLCLHAAACSDSSEPAPDMASEAETPAAAGSAGLPASPQAATTTTVFAPSDHSVHPSAGCGGGAAPPGIQQTLLTGGQEGTYLVTVPPSYDPNTPAALGFVFHGANNTEASCYGGGNCPGVEMALVDESIVIYPRSFGTSWTDATREQNVTWFDDLLAYVKANYCVDEHKVFVMGTSSGAHFSNILGCRRGDELRAIAPAAGERLEKTGCRGEFAALVIHGVDDGSVAGKGVPFAAGQEARDFYAQANGCSSETLPPLAEMHAEVRAARDAGTTPGIFRCVDYQGCREGLPVRWCEHSEGGFDGTTHGYPVEGGPTTWDFVSQL